MDVYARLAATATRLLKNYGVEVTYRQIVNGAAADPTKPWIVGSAVNTDHTVDVVFDNEKRVGYESNHYLASTEVPVGNDIVYMAEQSFTPKIKDVIIFDGKELTIESVKNIAPNGSAVLYEMRISS